jgi:DNA-directed RNA polymerase specialized sigma24 family protein
MPSQSDPAGVQPVHHKWFTTTHWSVVLAARESSPSAEAALQTLCRAYWSPLYAYVRRCGHGEHDAQDLTQSFIAQLLARNFLAGVTPHKGRFRSFLLAALKNFLASEHDRATAAKRGGGRAPVSLDADPEEAFLLAEPATLTTPEHLFERRWAIALMERAFARLREEFVAAGKTVQFARLKGYLEAEPERGEYTEAARDLKMSSSAVGVAVHRMRQRLGEIIRREIADTVASPEEINDEMRHLVTVLGRRSSETL